MTANQFYFDTEEEKRLSILAEYHLLDTPPEEDFERLAGLAARLFRAPIVLISLMERDRQFFKSHIGISACETSREISFCSYAIRQNGVFVIPDAMRDSRFLDNPLVIGPPFIRFYAGQPLIAPTGEKIGTLCVIDTKPRATFSEEDRKNLFDLSSIIMDRLELRRLDYMRMIDQTRFEKIAATSPDAIICSNAEADITFWNHAAEVLFGYSADEISRKKSDVLVPNSWRSIYDSELQRLKNGVAMELANRTIVLSGLRKDGTEFPAEFSLSTWKEKNTISVGAIVRDITERRQNEERLFRLASLDALTDLPNRGAWRDCLSDVLASGKQVSILLLDLDGFKEVNDAFGHAAGDAVLKEAATRLRVTCDSAIMVARLGGDEFVALLPDNNDIYAVATAERLVIALSAPYQFNGQKLEVGVSIGIALAPQHGTQPEELTSAADLALYRVKAIGKGRHELFTPSIGEVAAARRAFAHELREAFSNGEFEMFYQPQFSTFDRSITGAEALIRWNHPQRGLLTPASFIDVLSEKPSAAAVGEWIIRTACEKAAAWRTIIPNFRIGVNLFPVQFRTSRLLSVVKDILAEFDIPAKALELEIVENILLRSDVTTLKLLNDLRGLGVGLAFDDYGTGYASLSVLKRFPVTRLKIDRSFVRDVTTDTEDAAIVNAILYLGKNFHMDVIAEGVETEDQLNFLKANGCMEVQGYLLGRPMSAECFQKKFILSRFPECGITGGDTSSSEQALLATKLLSDRAGHQQAAP